MAASRPLASHEPFVPCRIASEYAIAYGLIKRMFEWPVVEDIDAGRARLLGFDLQLRYYMKVHEHTTPVA
jgi:hypothetical protein